MFAKTRVELLTIYDPDHQERKLTRIYLLIDGARFPPNYQQSPMADARWIPAHVWMTFFCTGFQQGFPFLTSSALGTRRNHSCSALTSCQ